MNIKVMGLLAIAVGMNASAARPLNVGCVSAAGYYGSFRVRSEGVGTEIFVKDGLGLSPTALLSGLKLIGENIFVSRLSMELPAGSCISDRNDPYQGFCQAKEVRIKVYDVGGLSKEVIVDKILLTLKRTKFPSGNINTSGLNFILEASNRSSGENLKSKTSQVFRISGSTDTSCTLN